MLKTPFSKVAASGLLISTLAGCANQLPQETVSSLDIDRELLQQSYSVRTESVGKAFLEQPVPQFSVSGHETFRVTTYNVNKTLGVYTPYQGAREIYELPGGLVMTAGGVVLSVIDVIPFFGMLPDAMTKDLLAKGVAGVNPFMNIESSARTDKVTLGEAVREAIDEKVEKSQAPLSAFTVTVALDQRSAALATDEQGLLTVDLLSLVDVTAPSSLLISTEDAAGKALHYEFPLTRQLSVRLLKARQLLGKYEQLDMAELTLSEAIEDLDTLSRWGFEKNALALELNIRTQLDEERRTAFDEQLMLALAR